MTAARQLRDLDHAQGLVTGRVALCEGPTFSVVPDDGAQLLLARRAASCLLAPQPQDRVLVAYTPEAYVLAVLDRDGAQPAELCVDGDVTIRAPTGRLDLAGADGVGLTTRGKISLLSRSLSVKSGAGEIFVKHLSAVAATAQAKLDKLSLVADEYDSFFERITERAKRAYRFVEEYDQLRARHIDYRADSTVQIKGESTVVTARQVAKIDGEQVHIG